MNQLQATNEDTCGPYFPVWASEEGREDLTVIRPGIVASPSGQQIVVSGRVLDRHGQPATGIVMEFWQANHKGLYRSPATARHPDIDPWFTGYGRLRSATGDYMLRTIMPGPVGVRASNITVTLFSDGISRIVTQMFFPNDGRHDTDPLLAGLDQAQRRRLIATIGDPEPDGCPVYNFDIVMAGDDETPFFDDMHS